MFALIDCNNFYASCERLFRPDLNGKPIVVLSNNDGCVIARSNEAKAAGIPMGAPAFKFEKEFKEKGIHVFSANFALYGDMSNRVMDVLSNYSPDIEIYSIDEAFLKLTGFEHFNLQSYAETIQKTVTKNTGIPVSVGIAPTKSLAKVANRIAKKFKVKNNVCLMDTDEKRIKALKWLQVGDVWGIGGRHAKRLRAMYVYNAYQFTQLSDDFVRKQMAIVGLRLKHDLQGIPTLDLETTQPKKNIATTRSFERNYTKLADLEERIATFAVSCAEKIRKQNSCCNSLMVFIHSNGHRKELPQYHRNIIIKLPFPTNSSMELAKFATLALRKIFKPNIMYKKAGVIIQDFTPEENAQVQLFENRNTKHIPLMLVVDKMNSAYGLQKIRLASQDLKRVWKMKQEKLSPRYTTNLKEVIIIKEEKS
jgi:DNA polymerase V